VSKPTLVAICARVSTDEQNPDRIEGGEAILKRLRRKPEPVGLERFEKLLKNRMEPVGYVIYCK